MFKRSVGFLVSAGQGPFDPYRILGVEPGASQQDIKRAYRRLALRFHPDGGPEGSADRFNAVHEAYEALKSGKWKPASGQRAETTANGHGWDSNARMYVYEKPGSTTENYVDSHTQTILRLVMVWCFLFVLMRLFLLQVFPNTRRTPSSLTNGTPPTGERTTDATLGGSTTDSAFSGSSVHDDDEQEAGWSLRSQMPQQTGSMTAPAEDRESAAAHMDPLARNRQVF